LTQNIAIKRYCDKKKYFWAVDSYWPREALNEPQIKVLYVSLRAYLGYSLKSVAQKYFFIVISFFLNLNIAKMSHQKKA